MVSERGYGWRRWWAVLALAALALSGCSGDDDDAGGTVASGDGSFTSSDDGGDDGAEFATGDDGSEQVAAGARAEGDGDAMEESSEAVDSAAQVADPGGGGADDGTGGDGVRPTDNRSIIFVATVDVVVEDVALSASLAKSQIAGLGGLVFGEETSVGTSTRTTLEFKVLPEDFDEALARLEGLGELRGQTITADDVTERVVDLQSRITSAAASVDRLRNFLEQAGSLEDIAELEVQLLQRETDLEVLRGQLRTLQDQVALATIFLTLSEPAPPAIEALGDVAVTYIEGADAGDRCPGVDDLQVNEGEPFTVCVEITNTGTNPIVDIDIRDNPLDLQPRDFTFVDGDNAEPLAPGETIVAWASREAPASGRSSVVVNGSVADADGTSLRQGVEFFQPNDASLRFVEDDSLPGFVDALRGSWGALVTALSVALLVLAALIPFLWVLPLLWFGRRLWLRQRARALDERQSRLAPPPIPEPAMADGD